MYFSPGGTRGLTQLQWVDDNWEDVSTVFPRRQALLGVDNRHRAGDNRGTIGTYGVRLR